MLNFYPLCAQRVPRPSNHAKWLPTQHLRVCIRSVLTRPKSIARVCNINLLYEQTVRDVAAGTCIAWMEKHRQAMGSIERREQALGWLQQTFVAWRRETREQAPRNNNMSQLRHVSHLFLCQVRVRPNREPCIPLVLCNREEGHRRRHVLAVTASPKAPIVINLNRTEAVAGDPRDRPVDRPRRVRTGRRLRANAT